MEECLKGLLKKSLEEFLKKILAGILLGECHVDISAGIYEAMPGRSSGSIPGEIVREIRRKNNKDEFL